jgi:UDP-N-acetylmuramate-alanine ligase
MHYHLIGICGTAMAALAGMLQSRDAVSKTVHRVV